MAIRDIYSRHEEQEREVGARRRPYAGEAPEATSNLIAILWRRKLTIAGSLALFLAAGILYIVVTPPRYLASTSMLIDPRLGKSVGTDPVQPGFIPDTSAMDSQIKLFTSQTVLSRVAKMAHLSDDPEFNGSQRSLLQRILHPMPVLLDAVDLKVLDNAISIKRPERTYVVGIDVLARNSAKAAEIANDVTKAYIEDQISSRLDAARDDTAFVRQRLDKLSSQIKDAENNVEAYKVQHNIVDANGLRSNQQQVVDLTRALGEARSKESTAKASFMEIDGLASRGHLDAASGALKSQTIERLRQQQAETEQNVAKLAMTLGPQHPELREAQGRQAKIERLIRNELQRLKMAATADYQEARRHETQIAAEVDRLKGQSATMNRALVPLEQLERNVRVLRSSFDRFAQVNDNLSQQEAESPPGRVIAVARPPVTPASPKKTIVGIVSLSAGLFFGLAAALLAESTAPQRLPDPPMVFDTPTEPPAPRPRATRRYWDDQDDDIRS